MEIRCKSVSSARLVEAWPSVLKSIKDDGFSVVAVREKEGEEASAVIVAPGLMRAMSEACDNYERMTQRPEYGELRSEVARLRRTVNVLFKELERVIGKEGEVPASLVEAIFGKETPASVVRLEGGETWKTISTEEGR